MTSTALTMRHFKGQFPFGGPHSGGLSEDEAFHLKIDVDDSGCYRMGTFSKLSKI